MKAFVQRGVHLANLPTPTRLVYTLFLLFIAIGLWTSFALYANRIGPHLRAEDGTPSVAGRYLDGGAARPRAGVGAAEGGQAPEGDKAGEVADDLELDLPPPDPTDDSAATPASTLVEAGVDRWPWILDVMHQHAFSVSVVWLILAHLFVLTRLHGAISGSVVLVSGAAALAHVIAPALIARTGGALWLMPLSGAAMGLSWTLMVGWSLAAMWLGIGRQDAQSR